MIDDALAHRPATRSGLDAHQGRHLDQVEEQMDELTKTMADRQVAGSPELRESKLPQRRP